MCHRARVFDLSTKHRCAPSRYHPLKDLLDPYLFVVIISRGYHVISPICSGTNYILAHCEEPLNCC